MGEFVEVGSETSSPAKKIKVEEDNVGTLVESTNSAINDDSDTLRCYGCDRTFPTLSSLGYSSLTTSSSKSKGKKRIMLLSSRASLQKQSGGDTPEGEGIQSFEAARNSKVVETMKFRCTGCEEVFCFECDHYVHEELHNCPGCLRG